MVFPFAKLSLTDPSTFFLLVLIASVGFLLMRASRHYSRQRRATSPRGLDAAWQAKGRGDVAGRSEELSAWTVEMHETARQLSAELDSKISALRAVTAEADRAAARLETALAKAGEAARPSGTQAEALGFPARGENEADEEKPKAEEPKARLSESSAEILPLGTRQRRRDEIYILADYGFGLAEIARRVDLPIGEVELILGLRKGE